MAEDYLAQGTAAAMAGDIPEARRLLAKAIFAAPQDERTWGRFYLVANTDQERIDCLERILRINPEHETAGELLKKYHAPEQPTQPSIKAEIPEKKKNKEKKKVPENKEKPGLDFRNDLPVRKASKFLLIFQLAALLLGIVFLLAHKNAAALLIAGVSLVLLLGALLWFYIRYQSYDLVKEKRSLDQHARKLHEHLVTCAGYVQLNRKNLSELEQAGKNEISTALYDLQKNYIETGMQAARIAEADIPGIEPELKQRLAASGFSSAADINIKVAYVEGVTGDTKRAILEWQDKVYFQFHAARPTSVPAERLEEIKKKYEVLQANNIAELHKLEQKQAELENALKAIQPRVDQLAPHTFLSFLRYGLAWRGFMAGLIGVGIIGSPIILGISALVAAFRASIFRQP